MQLLFYSLYSCFLNVKVGACLFYCLEIYVSLPLLSIVFMECVHLPAWEIDIQKKLQSMRTLYSITLKGTNNIHYDIKPKLCNKLIETEAKRTITRYFEMEDDIAGKCSLKVYTQHNVKTIIWLLFRLM